MPELIAWFPLVQLSQAGLFLLELLEVDLYPAQAFTDSHIHGSSNGTNVCRRHFVLETAIARFEDPGEETTHPQEPRFSDSSSSFLLFRFGLS